MNLTICILKEKLQYAMVVCYCAEAADEGNNFINPISAP